MKSALFKVNLEGEIKQTYFIEGYEASMSFKSVLTYLDVDALSWFNQYKTSNQPFLCKIKHEHVKCALCIPTLNDVLFFICDQVLDQPFRELIELFMELVRKLILYDAESNGHHSIFENIQKLNNELINKNREIAKMSYQLNRYNEILNNRLIKDPLTQLISRYQYMDEIDLAISKSIGKSSFFAYIDIDDFKSVNDNHGHGIGDEYLKVFAQRLSQTFSNHAVKIRISGDEFGLFIYQIEDLSEAYLNDFWQKIESSILYPIKINDLELDLSISMGIAIYSKEIQHIPLLIDRADQALYQAKRSGKRKMMIYKEA